MADATEYQHMIAVENHLETIENLLRELVQTMHRAENRDAEDRNR